MREVGRYIVGLNRMKLICMTIFLTVFAPRAIPAFQLMMPGFRLPLTTQTPTSLAKFGSFDGHLMANDHRAPPHPPYAKWQFSLR